MYNNVRSLDFILGAIKNTEGLRWGGEGERDDAEDKNLFKNLDVTFAAGSNLSAVRQTRYFIKVFVYYAQRAKIRYRNCLGELPAGSNETLVDKEVEKGNTHILFGWLTECGTSMASSLTMIPRTLSLNRNDFFFLCSEGGWNKFDF